MKKNRGDMPTKDGRFQGTLYECKVCGLALRKKDARWQRGGWVHRNTCWDERGYRENVSNR